MLTPDQYKKFQDWLKKFNLEELTQIRDLVRDAIYDRLDTQDRHILPPHKRKYPRK